MLIGTDVERITNEFGPFCLPFPHYLFILISANLIYPGNWPSINLNVRMMLFLILQLIVSVCDVDSPLVIQKCSLEEESTNKRPLFLNGINIMFWTVITEAQDITMQ